MVDEAYEERAKKKRGPKGGIRHTPGRGHASNSQPIKKRRLGKRLRKKRLTREDQARKQWEAWDKLPEEVKRLLGTKGEPKLPRPKHEN